MAEISDDYMKEKLAETKPFSLVILKKGPAFKMPDVYPIIWEHGRMNFSRKADGLLHVVCFINDGSEMAGIGIFTTDEEDTKKIMDEDPAVKAGVLVDEITPQKVFQEAVYPNKCRKCIV